MVMWSGLHIDHNSVLLHFLMPKEKVKSTKITNPIFLTQRIRNACTKIEGNVDLLQQIHESFAIRIKICIANDGNHIE